MFSEVSKIDLFEELLNNEDVTTADLADKMRSEFDPDYAEKNRPLTICERKAKIDKERRETQERIKNATRMELPVDFENQYEHDKRATQVYFESIPDALIYCYHELGCVDIEFISAITKSSYKTVIQSLRGSILQNPEKWQECFYKGWEIIDEYLSGNLLRKYKIARNANHVYKNWFSDNLKSIEKLLPKNILDENIYVHPSTPWIPPEIHDDFLKYLFGSPIRTYSSMAQVKHDEKTGTFDIPLKSAYRTNPDTYSKYGTRRLNALDIYEKTLNNSPIKVMDETFDYARSKIIKVINESETMLAIEKQKLLVKTFQDWIWKNPQRKLRLQMIFAEMYGFYRRRKFDGSFLKFPGLSEDKELYQYQKDAVARILFSPNVLLAHKVGSGKTYIMIASGMELKRMGRSKKNLYVVPNGILNQWGQFFNELYPNSNVLVVEPKNFKPENRDNTLELIRENDWDAVIMPFSIFDKIPLSKRWVFDKFLDEEESLKKYSKSWNKNTSGIRKAEKNLKSNTKKLLDKMSKYSMKYNFDELGFTRLFIDEAHNYKNVPIDTKNLAVRGINSVGSLRCEMLMEKVRFIQKINDGAGVVMATGTPLTNSLTDAFVLQSYLQKGELSLLDIHNFDAWCGMFAEADTDFEIDVDTNTYRLTTRLSKFHNMPEFTSLLSSVADFHDSNDKEDVPEFKGYTDHLIPQRPELKNYLQKISKRADDIHKKRVNRKEDNMLLLTVDGRKAALDMRLVDPAVTLSQDSKVYVCACEIIKIYRETKEKRLTQLVFCDTSTPSDKFNMYTELATILIKNGVSSKEVAFVHSAKTETQREKLFNAVRKGDIRILIGSTQKLGTGVNVQDKLIAVHHLDVPWRPADMVQREGRIIRQGNTNPEVFIHRYITQGSFDAYSWQLLEIKQRFISEILSGSVSDEDVSDIDDTVLDYAEIKALAVGNPLIKKRVETANELSRLKTLQRKSIEEKELLRKELLEIPNQRKYYDERIEETKDDILYLESSQEAVTVEERKELGKQLTEALEENVLEINEKRFGVYKGFDIILPSHMLKGQSYVWLQRRGRYKVDMGDNEKGNVIRIDNCIDGLNERLARFKDRLYEIRMRQTLIQEHLSKEENFVQKILAVEKDLKMIDQELGVKKNG